MSVSKQASSFFLSFLCLLIFEFLKKSEGNRLVSIKLKYKKLHTEKVLFKVILNVTFEKVQLVSIEVFDHTVTVRDIPQKDLQPHPLLKNTPCLIALSEMHFK